MDVGVYFDMRNPARWRRDPAEMYGAFPELCEEVEHLGLDSIWATEHHGFSDDYLPAPLTLLAAAAARTRRVRLGTGIVVAPLHEAAELAEQAAVVDLLSGGRLDLGLGAGYRPPEFDLYGADLRTRYRANDDRARQIRELWASRAVTPSPAQERLPIWMGYLGPKGARRAGRLGEFLLSPDARNWEHYRQGLAEGGHDPSIARMGGGVQAWVSEDPERDWPAVRDHLAEQANSYRLHGRMGYADLPPYKPVDPDVLRSRRPRGRTSADYFVFGTAAEVAEFVRGFTAGAPVDTVYFWAALPGMSAERVAANIRAIATELAPLLRTMDPVNQSALTGNPR
ncbi:LLM class flavin-dependent oxidoreductase [Nocardia sp. BSTN01]|uniref:LLM class flavin-dependent oxidoreductase n=1 Tax=Nocardia sp. BSTN01 TaxID=2783665 RepID=UPI00188F51F8|nr:LLM class flavin-dependent oxidoreductase [Nocardia sp. BSTN01]MBF4997419.1 LLM class flavin-dependent oxidoreductase [Nocardia sp. BSTN01]